MSKPNKFLFIIGSAKAGTTAFAHYLSNHPNLGIGAAKEPAYFTDFKDRTWSGPAAEHLLRNPFKDESSYFGLYSKLDETQWAIDGSTDYIWCERSPSLIRKFAENHEVKIVSIVRDPLDRAISEYNHTLRYGWETLSFGDSLDAEASRREAGWNPLFYHQRRSRIFHDIKRYAEMFGDDFLVLDYAELKHPETAAAKVLNLLGLPKTNLKPIQNLNESSLPRNRLSKLLLRQNALRNLGHFMLPPSVRHKIWDALHTSSKTLDTVRIHERKKYVELLADEVELCVKDPEIPTENWKSAHSLSSGQFSG